MKEDYLPSRDGDLDEWEENFSNKIPTHAPTVALAPGDYTPIVTAITTHRTSFSTMIMKKAEKKAAVEDNKSQKQSAIQGIRGLVKRVKAHPNYTEAIGADLGIIGSDVVDDPTTLKPELKGALLGGTSVIEFVKKRTDGVQIFSKRGNENSFTFLAVDTNSPYTDNRAKLNPNRPEERQYYAFYIMDDEAIGLQSDIITVIAP